MNMYNNNNNMYNTATTTINNNINNNNNNNTSNKHDEMYCNVMNTMNNISLPLNITSTSCYNEFMISPPLFTNEISQIIDENNRNNEVNQSHILHFTTNHSDHNDPSLSYLCDSLIEGTNKSMEEITMESEATEARLTGLLEKLSIKEKPRMKEFNNVLDDIEKQMRFIELEPEMAEIVIDEWLEEFIIDIWNETKPYVQLPEDEMEEAEELITTNENEVIIDSHNIEINGRAMCTLQDSTWLNDDIINFYCQLLKDRNHNYQSNGLPCIKVHFFNTFFFTKLLQRGQYKYKNVSRWSKRQKVDIISLDKLIIPVNISNSHWCLSCANFRDKRFEYYDSLSGSGQIYIKALRQYIIDEAKTYHNGMELDLSGWTVVTAANLSIPQQRNGTDCGVFTCKFAEYIVEDRPLTFSQQQMPYFRRRIALEIALDKVL